WHWNGRDAPQPVLEANRTDPPPGMTRHATVDGVSIHVAEPGREYASISHPDQSRTVCTARGVGGDIDVHCDAPQGGLLIVKENNWSSWHASLAGTPLPLEQDLWLEVQVPEGSYTVEFRYRPWDVPLGLTLGLL